MNPAQESPKRAPRQPQGTVPRASGSLLGSLGPLLGVVEVLLGVSWAFLGLSWALRVRNIASQEPKITQDIGCRKPLKNQTFLRFFETYGSPKTVQESQQRHQESSKRALYRLKGALGLPQGENHINAVLEEPEGRPGGPGKGKRAKDDVTSIAREPKEEPEGRPRGSGKGKRACGDPPLGVRRKPSICFSKGFCACKRRCSLGFMQLTLSNS